MTRAHLSHGSGRGSLRLGQPHDTVGPYPESAIQGKLGSVMNTLDNSGSRNGVLALSREEAARALGVSAFTVDRLAKRGLLHPSRATRRPLYPVWEIERFLRDTSKGPHINKAEA